MFWRRSDRQAIRTFLKFEAEFKNQPNYLELDEGTRADAYSSFVKKHIWCYNLMRNLGEHGTNQRGCLEYRKLPLTYGIVLDKSAAFSRYVESESLSSKDFMLD